MASAVAGLARRALARAQASGVRLMRRTPLAGRNTVILRYTAPRSGRQIELPVWAARHDRGWLVAVGASDVKTWWKAFRRPVPTTVDADGTTESFVGRLVTGADKAELLAAYFAEVPAARRTMTDPPLVRFARAG